MNISEGQRTQLLKNSGSEPKMDEVPYSAVSPFELATFHIFILYCRAVPILILGVGAITGDKTTLDNQIFLQTL